MSADLFNVAALRELVREVIREELAARDVAATTSAELLTIHECAGIAKVKPATVRSWVKAGTLAARKVGRHLRVARADLDALLAPGARRRGSDSPEERARREVGRLMARLL